MTDQTTPSDEEATLTRLLELKTEHRDLDDAIAALLDSGTYDMLKIQRMKKRKLALKDQIVRIESALYPDIIA